MNSNELNRIEDLQWILHDLSLDFPTVATLFRETVSRKDFDPRSNVYHLGICRICNTSAIISLVRLMEIQDKFGVALKDFPSELRDRLKEKLEYFNLKKVRTFRNVYAAHIQDSKTKKPLSLSDLKTLLEDIVGNNMLELHNFYDQICPEDVATNTDNIASIVHRLEKHCISLTNSEKRP